MVVVTPKTRPQDLITTREAAALVKRAETTVLEWKSKYKLKDWRESHKKGSPCLFERSALLEVAKRARASGRGRPPGPVRQPQHRQLHIPAKDLVAVSRPYLETLEKVCSMSCDLLRLQGLSSLADELTALCTKAKAK